MPLYSIRFDWSHNSNGEEGETEANTREARIRTKENDDNGKEEDNDESIDDAQANDNDDDEYDDASRNMMIVHEEV